MKQRINQLLLQIHRGFLPEGSEVSDEEILSNLPPDGLTSKLLPNGHSILVQKPFTRRWVTRKVKKNPHVTAYELLVAEGFKEPDA